MTLVSNTEEKKKVLEFYEIMNTSNIDLDAQKTFLNFSYKISFEYPGLRLQKQILLWLFTDYFNSFRYRLIIEATES